MTYKEALDRLIFAFRLDFDPVGLLFVTQEERACDLPQTHKTRNKLTFCQYVTAARQARYALFMEKERLLCRNAQLGFGFREVENIPDAKAHQKYLLDPDLSLQAARDKVHLPPGRYQGVYLAPLDTFDGLGRTPDVVYMMVLPFQGYHILNDYMAAMGKTHLNFRHTPNSAVCGGSVWAHLQQSPNMNTMCAGSKASGKTEMGYMNLTLPGSHFLPTVEQLGKRQQAHGGTSLVGKGDHPWPGLDACQGCPLFRFDPITKD
ncbi:DUF169 domain-containing protein [Desulfobotulus sp.]|jgi:uncharacterized protein (DUF169 family)|uniref:DUF169 domain-containing protein n=1 Tax=Desulfobotulus sp. TaxID=1940337 RepID=UPI002A366831|nr:DUF169 domain-containing protein [Desulfobotulus sp.]MDY0164076.1 DUF169 domain-containing protein [Desulfobotulus sp.]